MDNKIINNIINNDNEIIDIEFARDGIDSPFQGGWSVFYTTKKDKQKCFHIIEKELLKNKMTIRKSITNIYGSKVESKNFYIAESLNRSLGIVEFSIEQNDDNVCFISISVSLFM